MTRGVLRVIGWTGTGTMPLAVSLDDAKGHLRVLFDDEDALISAYLQAAINYYDGPGQWLNRALVDQDFAYDLTGFPCDAIRIPMCGVSAVKSITYIDAAGDTQTVSPTMYRLVTDKRFTAYVALKLGKSWPSVPMQDGAVTVTFTSGFGPDPAAVPAEIRGAILLYVGQLYERRGDDAGKPPAACDALVSSHTPVSV